MDRGRGGLLKVHWRGGGGTKSNDERATRQSSKIEGSIFTLMGVPGTIQMNKNSFEGQGRGRQFLEFI